MSKEIITMRAGNYITGFYDFIGYLKLTKNVSEMNIVEIGAYVGQSTVIFAENVNKVISIDPFVNDYDPNDGTCHAADLPTIVYQEFQKNITPYSNIEHIRKTSDDAIHDLQGQQFDLIYIDGVHTYDQVKKDIENYRKILKPGGLMCGHDYDPYWQGVMDAINEAFGKPDLKFADSTWVVQL